MKHESAAAAVTRGLAYVRTRQRPDGSFESYSSPTKHPFRTETTYHTTFVPAIILAALSHVAGDAARRISQPLAQWLLAQKGEQGSFNYWAKDAPERQHLPYPDDLDDTFCALIALYGHDPALVDGATLAQVVKLLVATEAQVGGPYHTWLVPSDAPAIWRDVDVAVNANVAGFLGLVAEPLPRLTHFLEEAIAKHRWQSPYYPSVYPAIYYAARAYQGPKTPLLIRSILKQSEKGIWNNSVLTTALMVSALRTLGYPSAKLEPALHFF